MIEVVLSNGDRAEADDPESALLAARTMIDDWRDAHPFFGMKRFEPTATFLVDGFAVRSGIGRREL